MRMIRAKPGSIKWKLAIKLGFCVISKDFIKPFKLKRRKQF